MDKRIIIILAVALWCFGCASAGTPPMGNNNQGAAAMAANPVKVGESDLVFNPEGAALPNLHDLPYPQNMMKIGRSYTGIIKNKTRYAVSIPSDNSDGTLIIPPYSWIEYTAWTKRFKVTAYHDGKPFYCLSINARFKEYPFMCQRYDFIAEIVKPEPAWKSKKLRKRVRHLEDRT